MILKCIDNKQQVVLKTSCYGYDHKPTDREIRTMCWSDGAIDILRLSEYISTGHTFVPLSRKKTECWNKYSNVVFIDIDHSDYTLDEHFNSIPYKPTVAYETYSGTLTDHRYRFVYVFDRLYNGKQFHSLLDWIVQENRISKYDKRQLNQYYNGTFDKKVITTGYVYVLPDNLEEETTATKTEQPKEEYKDLFSDDVWNNYWSMPLNDFKNWCFGEFGTELPLETPYIQKNDERILELPDKYLRLPVKYRWDKDLKTNIRLQWCDGENRYLKLWNCCMVLLRMQTLTADELLYHLVDYFLNYINNSDGKYSKMDLIEKVVKALDADISHSLNSGKYPTYRVDPLYCALHKVSKREVANRVNAEKHTAKKLERYKQIQQWYDPAKTDKENLVILSEHNIDISRDTLLRFKKWLKSNV